MQDYKHDIVLKSYENKLTLTRSFEIVQLTFSIKLFFNSLKYNSNSNNNSNTKLLSERFIFLL